VVLCEIVRSIS